MSRKKEPRIVTLRRELGQNILNRSSYIVHGYGGGTKTRQQREKKNIGNGILAHYILASLAFMGLTKRKANM